MAVSGSAAHAKIALHCNAMAQMKVAALGMDPPADIALVIGRVCLSPINMATWAAK
jgi:hypothetical protein